MAEEIVVTFDEKRTRKMGVGEDGKVHTRYYLCSRGEPGTPDELLLHLGVNMVETSARFLQAETPESRADELAILKAKETFHRHDEGEDA
ncbi:MAG TPA: hypothetical protein VFK04_12925 [Gemmatimonadaceae bacterium]|nr:hypothetical protein [Gemmatimonadaceae bacterium]